MKSKCYKEVIDLKISEKIAKIKQSEIFKVYFKGTIVGFRVKQYDFVNDKFLYYDFVLKMVASNSEIKDYINKNQKKFRCLNLIQYNNIYATQEEIDGKIVVSELKDEASAMNAILPVIRVYKLKEV